MRAGMICGLAILLHSCGGGGAASVGPPPPPPPPPPIDPMATGFEAGTITADSAGSFTIGDAPQTATFTGGEPGAAGTLARTGSGLWVVVAGATGIVSFATPVTDVDLWWRNELPATRAGADCGTADQGNDNSAAFGTALYVRGSFNDWGNPEPGPPYEFVNLGDAYEAEFELTAGDYEFKLADAGWTFEYALPGQTAIVGEAIRMGAVAAAGDPNTLLSIAADDCYTWQLRLADDSLVPAPLVDLTVRPAGPGSQVRVYDTDDNLIGSFEGSGVYQRIALSRSDVQSRIVRLEFENRTDGPDTVGRLLVDDFGFGIDDTPPAQVVGTAEAVLTGFDGVAPTGSFATGLGNFSVDRDSGALSGEVRVGGTVAVAVELRRGGTVLVSLVRDAADPGLWRVPGGALLGAAALADFLAGQFDVVVVTQAFAAGEIGGRLLPPGVVLLPDNGAIDERSPRDEIIYFVMTDRFFNGDTSNDLGGPAGTISSGGFNPFATGAWHGGDFAGLRQKLDYLQGLGITAIWVTPPVANRAVQPGSNGYHGYWAVDFARVDPHLGTDDEYRAFIADAHARGIKVYQDAVVNHTADIITYAENQFGYRPLSEPPYTPLVPPQFAGVKNPPWLNDTQYYHNRGNSNFSGGEDSIYGDFAGLDDIATEIPFVRAQLIGIFQDWVGNFDVDGFRLDTAQHVNIDFWTGFSPALVDYAQSLGKDHLTLFGEAFNGDTAFLSRFVTEGRLPSLLNFPLQFRLEEVIGGAGTARLQSLFMEDDRFSDADSDARDFVNFFGNHDIGRAGGLIATRLPDTDDEARVELSKLAHAMLFFLRGVPTIYYGDEQGFVSDGGDQDAREDMMPSRVLSYNDNDLIGSDDSTAIANFDQAHPLYRAFGRLAQVYGNHRALRHGVQAERYSEPGAGLYAVSRIDPDERVEYLVVFNTSAAVDAASVATDTPGADWFAVWPPGGPSVASTAGGMLEVSVPGYGFAIYRAATQLADAPAIPSVAIVGREDGDTIGGTAELLTDVTTQGFVRVWFEISVDGGPFEFAGEDFDTPHRLYFNTRPLPDLTPVTVRVNVDNAAGDTVSSTLALVADNRPPAPVDNPYGVAVFLRGSFNDWGLANEMDYDADASEFNASLFLAAGIHAFKIASEDWSTADFGSDGIDTQVVPGVPKTLVRSSNNLGLTLDAAGSYTFRVDATSPEAPVLVVE